MKMKYIMDFSVAAIGTRCVSHNARVGGSPTSKHLIKRRTAI